MEMAGRRIGISFISIFLFVGLFAVACAAKGQAVLVVLDAVSVSEFRDAETPFLDSLSKRSSLGLMSTKTEANANPGNGYMSIGAGARGLGGGDASQFGYNAGEKLNGRTAAEVFKSRTGMDLQPDAVALLELSGVVAANMDQQLQQLKLTPGALGDILHKAGLKTGAIGNADVPEVTRRQVVSIAMDSKGIVDYGDVSERLLTKDPSSPAGYSTDYEKVLSKYDEIKDKVDFCVIDLGDSSRIEELSSHITSDMIKKHRIASIEKADRFIGELARRLDLIESMLLVVVPSPSMDANRRGDRLTPILGAGRGFEEGFLISPSTRWPGIVLNIDIAPTIISFFGLKNKEGIVGRAMTTSAGPLLSTQSRLDYLVDTGEELITLNEQRSTVLRIFTTIQIILLLIVGAYLLFSRRFSGKWFRAFEAWAVYIATAPLAFLLMALIPPQSPFTTVPSVLLIIWIVGMLARKLTRDSVNSLKVISAATVLLTLADVLYKQHLARYSLLSYNPVVAARFYGLGNEYTGVVMGAAIVGSLLIVDHKHNGRGRMTLLGLIYAAVFFIIAHPAFGADFGGALSAFIGFSFTWFLLTGRKFSTKAVLSIGLGCLLMIAALIGIDLIRGKETSHLGRLVESIREGGLTELYYVIIRKLDVNIRLVRRTIWSRVLLAMALPVAIVGVKSGDVIEKFRTKCGFEWKILLGSLVAAAVAFAVNDSGIVAADTLLIYPASLALVVILRLLCDNDDEKGAGL